MVSCLDLHEHQWLGDWFLLGGRGVAAPQSHHYYSDLC